MAGWRGWLRRLSFGAALGGVAFCGGVRAELLSTYFPTGVPGYGEGRV